MLFGFHLFLFLFSNIENQRAAGNVIQLIKKKLSLIYFDLPRAQNRFECNKPHY